MPQVIAAAAVYAGASAAAASVIGYATTVVASLAYSRYSQRKAQRQQNQSLQDRTRSVPQSDAARAIVYGRTRVGGTIVYHRTHGANRESVSHVITLAGHEITAVDDVWFNDASIAPWPGTGAVTTGSPYFLTRPGITAHSYTAGGNNSQAALPMEAGWTLLGVETVVVDMPDPAAGYYVVNGEQALVSNPSTVSLAAGVDYSVGGTLSAPIVTLLSGAYAGGTATVTYRVERGEAYARVYPFLGLAAGERDLDLEGWSGGEWTSSAIGQNVARLHVLTTWQETLYATGFPSVTAIVRGKKVYDPRLDSTNGGSGTHRADTASTWAYSDNPALCAVDYLRDGLGFGCASTEIDWPSVIAAANVCDESVTVSGTGATQKRYVVAGWLSTETDRKTNLEAILDSMVGIAVYSGGKWSIRAGAYTTPTLDLDDTDLAGGDITIQARANRRDLFNAVRGRYRVPAELYQVTDFPPYASSTYATEDAGEVIYREIDLQMVDDPYRAQRIAKLLLFRARQALTFSATFKLGAYALQPGDTCRITIARYGWTNKVFRVLRREFDSLSTVRLTLQEDASAIYAWNYSEQVAPDPAPNTALADPRFVALPSGLAIRGDATTYYVRPDGAVVPYLEVSWTVPAEDDVRIEVFWKRANENEFRRIAPPVGASYAWIEGVSPGETLNLYVEAVNAIGARSPMFIRPAYAVSDELQSSNRALSSNLLRGAALDANFALLPAVIVGGTATDTAGFAKSPDAQFNVAGSPSSAYLWVRSTRTGSAAYAYREWPRVSALSGEFFAAYAMLSPWNTNGAVGMSFFDAAGSQIGATVFGNSVSDRAVDWDNPTSYALSGVVAEAPANTRTVAFGVYARGAWVDGTFFFEKSVSVHRPYLGRVASAAAQLPAWDGGTANVVDSALIAPGAATTVYEDRRAPGAIAWPGSSDYYTAGLPSLVIPFGTDIEDGTLLRVHASAMLSMTGGGAAGSLTDISVLAVLVDLPLSAGGAVVSIPVGSFSPSDEPYPIGFAYSGSVVYAGAVFEEHFSTARSMVGVTLTGSIQWSATFKWVRGYARRFALSLQWPGGNATAWSLALSSPSRITVEVLKR